MTTVTFGVDVSEAGNRRGPGMGSPVHPSGRTASPMQERTGKGSNWRPKNVHAGRAKEGRGNASCPRLPRGWVQFQEKPRPILSRPLRTRSPPRPFRSPRFDSIGGRKRGGEPGSLNARRGGAATCASAVRFASFRVP